MKEKQLTKQYTNKYHKQYDELTKKLSQPFPDPTNPSLSSSTPLIDYSDIDSKFEKEEISAQEAYFILLYRCYSKENPPNRLRAIYKKLDPKDRFAVETSAFQYQKSENIYLDLMNYKIEHTNKDYKDEYLTWLEANDFKNYFMSKGISLDREQYGKCKDFKFDIYGLMVSLLNKKSKLDEINNCSLKLTAFYDLLDRNNPIIVNRIHTEFQKTDEFNKQMSLYRFLNHLNKFEDQVHTLQMNAASKQGEKAMTEIELGNNKTELRDTYKQLNKQADEIFNQGQTKDGKILGIVFMFLGALFTAGSVALIALAPPLGGVMTGASLLLFAQGVALYKGFGFFKFSTPDELASKELINGINEAGEQAIQTVIKKSGQENEEDTPDLLNKIPNT